MTRLARCLILGLSLSFATIVLAEPPKKPAPPKDDPFKAGVRTTEPLAPEAQRAAFHLPSGFEIQLVAAEPDLRKPMNMQWDALGRLWITESREYPFPAELDAVGRDTVRIFSDFDATGRARKVEIFADGLNIPIGLYPFRSPNAAGKTTWKCIVWSIPNIWLMEDADDDGRADRREVLYGPLGWQRDTHGNLASFRRGLDGWLYGTHGFSNETTFVGRDKQEVKLTSGNTWRAKLDGEHVEWWTRGQVNPFGLAWDDRGNLFSADCHSSPLYQLLRGGWYPSFGRPHDGLGFAPLTVQHSHNSTAIDAPMYVCDTAWPAEWQDHMFIGNVMTSSLNHDRIEWHGTSSKGVELPDFLTTDDPWFRPVDLSWGPDGALYIADFYNRIIGHYEVPLSHPGRDRERGRLWRVVYVGAKGDQKRPSLALPTDVAGLVKELGSSNPTRRRLALDDLTDRVGRAAIPALQHALASPTNAFQKFSALYALHRLQALDEAPLLAALTDRDAFVRIHAAKLAAEVAGTATLRQRLQESLADADPFVVRAAVEALGVHRDPANVGLLVDLLERVPPEDDHLRYAVRVSLRYQLADERVLAAVDFAKFDEARLPPLVDILNAVSTAAAAERQLALLERSRSSKEQLAEQLPNLAKRLPPARHAGLVTVARQHFGDDVEAHAQLLRGLLDADAERGNKLDAEMQVWAEKTARAFVKSVRADEQAKTIAKRLALAADLVRRLKLQDQASSLEALFADARGDTDSRIAAADAIAALTPQRLSAVYPVLLDATRSFNERQRLATIVAKVRLPEADAALVEALQKAGASQRPVFAGALAGSLDGAAKLVEACAAGRVPAAILRDRGVVDRLKAHKSKSLDEQVAALTAKLPPANVEADAAIAERRTAFSTAKPDAARGAELFTKHCSACHAVGGKGGNISPQLDGIGSRGTERLIEDILDPNRNVDRAFRSAVIVTDDGLVVTGLVRRTEGKLLVLADSAGKERTIATDDIESRTESETSIMPTGFNDALRGNDFYDLIAFLLAAKKAAH
jgi:putative heme-binding domain-containing protein